MLGFVGGVANERGLVELPVAGVKDKAVGCADREARGLRNRVRHGDELATEGSDSNLAPSGISVIGIFRRLPNSESLALRKAAVKGVAKTGHLRRGHNSITRADVVLVRVREHDAGERF